MKREPLDCNYLLSVLPLCFLTTANPTCGDIFRTLFQSSKLKRSFHRNVAKETFELWALVFETAFEHITPSGIGCMFTWNFAESPGLSAHTCNRNPHTKILQFWSGQSPEPNERWWWWLCYSQSHLGCHFRKLKAQSSKLKHLFGHFLVKREVRALIFELETAFENVNPSGIGCNIPA